MNTYSILETMLLIRAFERKVEEYFSKGIMRGTTHCSVGQELSPSCIGEMVDIKKDYLFATHRGHGYFLACTHQPYLLACEMMGRRDGPVFGGGGSQHIKYNNFYTSGITGGMVPVAVGTAFALKIQKKGAICISIIGDGGFNEGYVQEALNLAAVYQVPILFLLENNKYAMSTESAKHTAGSIKERVQSFDIPYTGIDQKAPDIFHAALKQTVDKVRMLKTPQFVEVDTYRFCGHSKSDNCEYMNPVERETYISADPLEYFLRQIDKAETDKLSRATENMVNKAFQDAEQCNEITLHEFVIKAEERTNEN
jgi:TPP-dependent pyruvate/acetoin dehydrogenase alpha subunit